MKAAATARHLVLLSWRDTSHPRRGGAEEYTHQVLKRLVKQGWRVTHIGCAWPDCTPQEVIDGVQYMRQGGALGVLWFARKWVRQHRADIDVLVDQSNTHQFVTPLWCPKEIRRVFFIHQLTREIWFQQLPWWQAVWGYLLEPMLLWLQSGTPALTVSQGTKHGLEQFGHDSQRVHIMPEGIDFVPWAPSQRALKPEKLQLIYVGRYSAYKGVDAAVEVIGLLRRRGIVAQLDLVGRCPDSYKKHLMQLADAWHVPQQITWHGFVTEQKKLQLMSRAHALLFPSQREGWGLTVTEANAVGTVAIGYPSPGLMSSIRHNKTGIITKEKTAVSLADAVSELWANADKRADLQAAAHAWSGTLTWCAAADQWDAFLSALCTGKPNPHRTK